MKTGLLLLVLAVMTTAYGQESSPSIKVTDIENVTTEVRSPSSSSATSCNSPDFPVIRGGSRNDINFNEISWLTVRHDLKATNSEIYIPVELTYRSGRAEEAEMIRNIRITGVADGGEFSIRVKDINTLQVLH